MIFSRKATAPPRKTPSSGRVLLIVAGLFVASAAIRIFDGSGVAVAREVGSLTRPEPPAVESTATQAELAVLLEDVRRRETEVIEKERALEARAAAAKLAEEKVSEALHELELAERELRATMALADEAAESDLTQLTAVYENMKPQQAAPLFAQMTPSFAAGFLGRMRPDAAAAIMAGLEPEAAYAISVILAGRNADVPRPNASN